MLIGRFAWGVEYGVVAEGRMCFFSADKGRG